MAPGPQLGTGTTAVYDSNGSGPIGYIASHYTSADGFEEVILAKKGALSVPLHVGLFDLVGMNTTNHSSPRSAESALKQYLGISSNNQLDRWWVNSPTIPSVVQAFPDPPTGFSLYQVAGMAPSGTTDPSLMWAAFTKSGSYGTVDSFLLIASSSSTSPALPAVQHDIFSVSGATLPTGAAFEALVQTYMQGFTRWSGQEKLKKYGSSSTYPSSW